MNNSTIYDMVASLSPEGSVDLNKTTSFNSSFIELNRTYVIEIKLIGVGSVDNITFNVDTSSNLSAVNNTPLKLDGSDVVVSYVITNTSIGDGWLSVSTNSDRRNTYHFLVGIPIELTASVNHSLVITKQNESPSDAPVISITYANADSIVIIGGPNTLFNTGNSVTLDVENSTTPATLKKFFPFTFFDNQFGRKSLLVSALNLNGRSKTEPIKIEFKSFDVAEGEAIFSDPKINKQAIFSEQDIIVSYVPRNTERFFIDDGAAGGFVIPDVIVGLQSYENIEIQYVLDTRPLESRIRDIKVHSGVPLGTYRVFIESAVRYDDVGDTRVYINSLLTIQPGIAKSSLTISELTDQLFIGICGDVEIPLNINHIINDKKVLRNILVSDDGTEQLMFSYVTDVNDSIVAKLYEPTESTNLDSFFIAYEVMDSSIVNLKFERGSVVVRNELRGPNFDIDDSMDLGLPISNNEIVGADTRNGTAMYRADDLLNYKTDAEHNTISDDDLTGYGYISSGSATTDIMNSVLGGSNFITDANLDIDYTSFSNFVFYSSADERLTNFKYKLQLIEADQLKINNINDGGAVTGSILVNRELGKLSSNINRIKTSFDGYENFLYLDEGNSSWPKSNGSVIHTSGSNSIAYFASQSAIAQTYDDSNFDSLANLLPEHIIRDSANVDFVLFTTMLGQHFDIIKSHIDSMSNVYVRTHTSGSGTPTELLKPVLEAFGWQIRTSGSDRELTDYILGKNLDGSNLSSSTAKKREELLLRRFLNNLPFLLKTKGTRASIRAIFHIYGIPDGFVQIREFGGPTLMTRKNIYYTFDDPIAELKLSGSEQIEIDWVDSDLSRKPDSLEISFRTTNIPEFNSPAISGSWNLLTGKSGSTDTINVFIDSEPSSSYNGRVRLAISSSTGISQISSSKLPLFDGDSFTMMVTRTSGSVTDNFDLYVKKSLYTKITHASSASVNVATSSWEDVTDIIIGNEFSGSVDEFSVWKVPLTETSFDHHVRWHESIRGNNYTSSVQDLLVRLTFDRPQNLATSTLLPNFAYTGSNGYGVSHATASNFTTVVSDPFQFTRIEQDSSFEVPTLGFRYESDKIRFESQSFLDGKQLERNSRITKKSFDQSPIDSNRLGVFFSPTTEINRDMIRAFGGHDFMNEIGDPDARYSSSYADLSAINEHYWERNSSSMNIYDYITLIRQFDKTVFEYVEDMTPIRAKLSKGILFEPHMLERNKIAFKKPSLLEYSAEGTINAIDTGSMASGIVTSYSTTLFVTESILMTGDQTSYSGSVFTTESIFMTGDHTTYDGDVGSILSGSTAIDFNQESKAIMVGYYENYKVPNHSGPNFASASYNYTSFGMPQSIFGIYAIEGDAEIIYLKDGVEGRKRVKLELIDIDSYKTVSQLIDGNTDSQEGAYHNVIVTESIQHLNVLHSSASFTAGGTKVHGHLPFHTSKTQNISTGLRNSFYKGVDLTEETTIDGAPPIEVFISNVGTIKVNKSDRSNDEPILNVE